MIGVVFGGAGLKIIEHLLNRGSKKEDLASDLRAELRQDIASLRTELKLESAEADKWKQMFYEVKYSAQMANYKTDKLVQETGSEELKNDLRELRAPDK